MGKGIPLVIKLYPILYMITNVGAFTFVQTTRNVLNYPRWHGVPLKIHTMGVLINFHTEHMRVKPHWQTRDFITVKGNATINGDSRGSPAIILTDGAKLIIDGNCTSSSDGKLAINDGTLEVGGNLNLNYSGSLIMTDDLGYVLVKGDFLSSSSRSSDLTKGTLEVMGNFNESGKTSYPYYSTFEPTGNFKVLLSGSSKQTITIDSKSALAVLEITNTSAEGLEFASQTRVVTLLKQTTSKIINSKNIYLFGEADIEDNIWNYDITLYNWQGNENLTINGDAYLLNSNISNDRYPKYELILISNIEVNGNLFCVDYSSNNKIQLNSENSLLHIRGNAEILYSQMTLFDGAKLIIDGNCRVSGSQSLLKLNNGRIEIGGNFELPYGGTLNMTDDLGYFLIKGDFLSSTYSSILTNGTLEVRGNFTQNSPYSSATFSPTGYFKVLLSGSNKQTVIMQGNSAFAVLEITNSSAEGVEFASRLTVNRLFNHNQNIFTLKSGGTFVDYDKDGLLDNVDPYPLDPTNAKYILWIENVTVLSDNDIEVKTYNYHDENVVGVLFVGIYENNKLIELKKANEVFGAINSTITPVHFDIAIDTTKHTIQVYIWEKAESLMPLAQALKI